MLKRIPLNKSDLLTGIITAVVFIFLAFSAFPIFENLERIIYGVEMRLDLPRTLGANKIAIVNIDDKSLKQIGPWPWPRSLIADMITILKDNGAKLISLDMNFSEKEQNQGLQEIGNLAKEITSRGESDSSDWILERLKGIEKKLDNDRVHILCYREN